jgi:ATP-dependent Clp protease ATP-binding subunit ClpX
MHILTEPKNAIARQYQHLFALENAKLTFTPGALRKIAEKALKRDTGARALRAVMEELMLDLMYELPEHRHEGAEYVIDERAIERKGSLAELRVNRKEIA